MYKYQQQQQLAYATLPRSASVHQPYAPQHYTNYQNALVKPVEPSNTTSSMTENEQLDSSYYTPNQSQDPYSQYTNSSKKYKFNGKPEHAGHVLRSESTKQNVNSYQNMAYANSQLNTSVHEQTMQNNYSLSRADDYLINNFRPFTGSSASSNNPNHYHQSLAASNPNSRLYQAPNAYQNGTNTPYNGYKENTIQRTSHASIIASQINGAGSRGHYANHHTTQAPTPHSTHHHVHNANGYHKQPVVEPVNQTSAYKKIIDEGNHLDRHRQYNNYSNYPSGSYNRSNSSTNPNHQPTAYANLDAYEEHDYRRDPNG